jgi:signal transduction histidine kinase
VAIADIRHDVAQSIENAKLDLDRALVELDRIPTLDPSAVAFVAHAMSNYLSVTDAVLGLLRDALANHPDPEVLGWLESLHHVSDMAHQTVARLLRVYEPAEMPLKFEYVRLERLIERACDYHRRSATAKQVEITCKYPSDLPEVWADRVAIAVVADNLLSNAVKFSYRFGRIDVALEAGPGGVICSVRDHGPGLTPLLQARLFERGEVPGHPPPSDQHPMGYGLLVAKAFMDRLNGRLWSESQPGEGATFSFRVPFHAREDPRRC